MIRLCQQSLDEVWNEINVLLNPVLHAVGHTEGDDETTPRVTVMPKISSSPHLVEFEFCPHAKRISLKPTIRLAFVCAHNIVCYVVCSDRNLHSKL